MLQLTVSNRIGNCNCNWQIWKTITIVDSRLWPCYATHDEYWLVSIVKQYLIAISTVNCWTVSMTTGAAQPDWGVLGHTSKTARWTSGPVDCSGLCSLSHVHLCHHLANYTAPCVILPAGPMVWKYDVIHKTRHTLVHNVLQRCQRRTEPQPQATWTKNLAKFSSAGV